MNTNDQYYPDLEFEGNVVGSGGCFPAGSLVWTHTGHKPIERLRKGDLVIAFDKFNQLHTGVVTETHKHSKSENNSGLYTFTFDDDTKLTATGNHAVFCADETESNFKRADEFVVGQSMYSPKGVAKVITAIDVAEIADDQFTYNLTVYPQHTYTVNGIRVHNGGGGKKKSTPRPAQESPNTLRSTNIARIMEVLSEGPIDGLITGSLKDVYFDNTPVQNSDDSYNFSVMQADFRMGLPEQEYVTGFNGVESVININTELTTSQDVTQSLQASTDSVVVIVRLPSGLFKQNTTNGDITGTSVQIAFDVKPTDGTWVEVMTPTIQGKTTSTYDVGYRLNRPVGATTWDVRARRVTSDPSSSAITNATSIFTITEIQEIKLTYPDIAYVACALDAQSVGNQIPVRSFDVKGLICKIPSNYDPILREYDGVWDGTFQYAWTDNPAWVVYDLLTNERYGLGSYIDEESIDVWSFYAAAQYNDQLVDDGDGGTEPRFTFNQPISVQTDAWKTIQTVASVMRAVVIPSGIITLMQDRPDSPVKIVTNSNVKDGVFTYTGSGLLARHTVVNVTYNDKNDRYLPRVVTEEDTDAINRYGYNVVDLTAYGAVTEGQARRAARWLLETELNQTEMVQYQCGFNQADLVPGDIIYLMDNDYVTKYLAGRIVGGTTTSVILDSTVTLNPSTTYTLTVLSADGSTLIERTITTAAGNVSTVTINTPLPTSASDLKGREWMITSAADVEARQFRVINVREDEKGQFTVSALFYDPDKYSRVEGGLFNPTPVYSAIEADFVSQVSNVVGKLVTIEDPVRGPIINLQITWDKPSTKYTSGYLVAWSRDNGPFTEQMRVDTNTFTIENALSGNYLVQIIAYNVKAIQSAPYVQSLNMVYSTENSLLPPINLQLVAGFGTGSEWFGTTLSVQWEAHPNNLLLLEDVIGGYLVEVYDNTTSTLLRTERLARDQFQYDYTLEDNYRDGGPRRELRIEVYTLDSFGTPSDNSISDVFTNEPPAVPSDVLLVGAQGGFKLTFDLPSERDFAGVYVWGSTTDGFTVSGSNLLATTSVPYVSVVGLDDDTTYYVKIAAFDSFSNPTDGTGLTLSGQLTVTTSPQPGIQSSPTDPLDPAEGDFYYNTTDGKLYTFNGTAWVAVVAEITGEITETNIADGAISTPKLAANAVTADKIAANTITADQIAANAITAGEIAASAVTAEKIDTSAITTDKLAANAVTADKIAAGTITANEIASQTITSAQIAAGTITANEIEAGSITADRLTAGTITADSGVIGTAAIDTLQLKNGSVTDVSSLTVTSPVVVASTTWSAQSYTQSQSYGDTELYKMVFTTANPAIAESALFTYLQTYVLFEIYAPSTVTLGGAGLQSSVSATVSHNVRYYARLVDTATTQVVWTSPVNNATVNLSVGAIRSGFNSSLSIGQQYGQELTFATLNLNKNTRYALEIRAAAGSWSCVNTTTTAIPLQIRALTRSAYLQTLLR